jgi:hypothetical protein
MTAVVLSKETSRDSEKASIEVSVSESDLLYLNLESPIKLGLVA